MPAARSPIQADDVRLAQSVANLRSSVRHLEDRHAKLLATCGLPPLVGEAAADQTPSRLATFTPVASTAAKNQVALDASFSPIKSRHSQSFVSPTNAGFDFDETAGLAEKSGKSSKKPTRRQVTFHEVEQASTVSSDSWAYKAAQARPHLSAFASPQLPSVEKSPSVSRVADQDRSTFEADYRMLNTLVAHAYYASSSVDHYIRFLEDALIKLKEKPNVERLVFIMNDLATRSTEVASHVSGWYASANMANTQILFSERGPQFRAHLIDVAHRRAQAATKAAQDAAPSQARAHRPRPPTGDGLSPSAPMY